MQSWFWRRLSVSLQHPMSGSAGGAAGEASDVRHHKARDCLRDRDPDAGGHQARKELDTRRQPRTVAISSPRLIPASPRLIPATLGLLVAAARDEQLGEGIVLTEAGSRVCARAGCRSAMPNAAPCIDPA